MSQKWFRIRVPLSVATVSGFSAAFGLAKALFALNLLAAATVSAVTVGPYAVIVLGTVDAVIGVVVAVVGVFLVSRSHWALKWVRVGWLPLIFYEVGRALGAASARPVEVSGYQVVIDLILLLCFLLVWRCIQLPSVDGYIESRRQGTAT